MEIIAGNYNTQDGLVNGLDGIFRAYTKEENVDIVCIEFHDPKIGMQQKNRLAQYYNEFTERKWVPILQIARPFPKFFLTRKITIRK